MSETPVHARMLIGGQWVDGPRRADVRNPANTDEVVGSVVLGTAADAERAIAAAKAAQPAWAKRGFIERARILGEALDRFATEMEPRARLYARENGKTLAEAIGEFRGLIAGQKVSLSYAADLDAGRSLDAPSGRTFIRYLPHGVAVSIVPWNAPVVLAFLHVIPALLGGNAMVVKPPESCPLALIDSLAVVADLLPPGVLNIVTGTPADLGETLTTHPDVAKIGFTGSIPSARHIAGKAAQSIKSVTLELGGNDPAIVLDDVDLGDENMKRMANSVFSCTGQVCMAIKRIYVDERIARPFIEAFTKAVDSYVVGAGVAEGVTMGPMHTPAGLDRAQSLIADSKRRGATVRELGQVRDPAGFEKGYFVRPTIVTDIAEDAPLMAEEQFCPVIPIVTYKNLDDAIDRANHTWFGLSASVWSSDYERALEVARKLEAGAVFVNTHGVASVNRRAPYGGMKQSGIGRKGGTEGILEYLQVQTITTYGETA